MARYLYVVLANPVEDQDEAFNRFYDEHHIPDVLRIPGMKSVQRFQLSPEQRQAAPSPFRYLAIWEIETDDIRALGAEIARRSGTSEMPKNPYICQDPKFAYFFQPLDVEPI